jgi:hypothetical protein
MYTSHMPPCPRQLFNHDPCSDDSHVRGSITAKNDIMSMSALSGSQGYWAADDVDGSCGCEGGTMPKASARAWGTTAADTPLKLPVMLGSLPLTMLPFLLPLYAKQFGATALGIGDSVAQG